MNAIRPYWMLAKREVWEHKSLWIVPIVVACLVALGSSYGGVALIVAAHQGVITVNNMGISGDARGGLHIAMLAMAGLFNVVMLFMVWFYLMDSLYADRKDRSVLFWRSMPVSDTATVLSKLFTGMVTAPAFMFVLVVIVEIVAGMIFTIASGIIGVNLLHEAFYPGTIILTWIVLAFALIQQSLWLLPYWGWFLLCSAWAKKLVLAWVVLIPLGAILIELIVFRSHYLSDGILGHIGRGLVLFGSYGKHGPQMGFHGGAHIFGQPGDIAVTLGSVAYMFTLPEMWIGVGIGIIFILGAIWLRRHRSEI
ncbi:MAG: hypothetical protein KGL00_08900 [Gammaproteobacteria bacterium]|nr:hypothetical protein [Gammaproteobacteria bacterium]MDE1887563.1 hypothetical protein [Gammaproteobacteria bacterium]MDE2023506.1 hypothetical protein [Gammaproteobacteria bacterium]MDE2274305.1 hypothetical protein [Gammaproteobacteria bacterium]